MSSNFLSNLSPKRDDDCHQLNESLDTDSTVSTSTDLSFESPIRDTPTIIRNRRDRSIDPSYIFRIPNPSEDKQISSKHFQTSVTRRKTDLGRALASIPVEFKFGLMALMIFGSLCYLCMFHGCLDMDRMAWRKFLRSDARKLVRKIQSRGSGKEFIIRLQGSRLDLLQQSLHAHAWCPFVKEIQIDWSDKTKNLPSSLLQWLWSGRSGDGYSSI